MATKGSKIEMGEAGEEEKKGLREGKRTGKILMGEYKCTAPTSSTELMFNNHFFIEN